MFLIYVNSLGLGHGCKWFANDFKFYVCYPRVGGSSALQFQPDLDESKVMCSN